MELQLPGDDDNIDDDDEDDSDEDDNDDDDDGSISVRHTGHFSFLLRENKVI